MPSQSDSRFALTSDARVFIAPRGVGCGRRYEYHNCMKMAGISKSFGESEPVYCPDPTRSGQFIEVATIQGTEDRWSGSMTGPKPLGLRSVLELLSKQRCEFDAQVHFGRCVDPSQFSSYEQAIIIEGMRISDYSTDDLVALNPGERALVNETVSFSARVIYEIFGLTLYETAASSTTDLCVVSIDQCAPTFCDDDCLESCQYFFALGIPCITNPSGQPISILVTTNGGTSWEEVVLPCAATTASQMSAFNIVCAGSSLFISVDEVGGLGHVYVVPTNNVINGAATGASFEALGYSVYDLWHHQGVVWAAGEDGKLSAIDVSSLDFTTLSDPTNFPSNWYSVHGLDSDNLIVGGAVGQFGLRKRGGNLQEVVVLDINGGPVTDDITAVQMKSVRNWYVGTKGGNLYCTADEGKTWSRAGAFPGCIVDIEFPTNNSGYLAIGSPPAIYSTIDGGTTWSVVSDNLAQVPEAGLLFDLAVCPEDPNFFMVAGRVPEESLDDPCDPVASQASQPCASSGDIGFIVLGRP